MQKGFHKWWGEILLLAKAKSSKNFYVDLIFLDSSDKRGSIFDEKSGLRSHEQGNKTDSSIDEASGKSPRFIAKRQSRLDSSPQGA